MSFQRWQVWLVPAAGALVLVSSLTPWWTLDIADGGALAEGGTGSVTAWETSGWWPVAVTIGLLVAVTWTGWRLTRGEVPGRVSGLLALASLAPIVLCVHQWRGIQPPPPLPEPDAAPELSATAYIQRGDPFTTPGLDPDHLFRVEGGLVPQGPGWGLYAGIACLAMLAIALTLNAARPRSRRS
ncbi:hypothetical protein ACQEVZ_44110 [Dactylosporangium sp. CA-152071]|uniref:hypothetical protein n=1 Tax=Dactylosporangium sp. CA-152071 TaxID=3239933 RepID=UPI003D94A49B